MRENIIALDVPAALRGVAQRLMSEPYSFETCPTFTIDSIFPQELYELTHKYWPSRDLFEPISYGSTVAKGAYEGRHNLLLKDEVVQSLPESIRVFWSYVADWLNSTEFIQSMVDKCYPVLSERFGDSLPGKRFFARSLLTFDDGPMALGPHTDAPSRAVALLFYCPPDERAIEQGTSLYVPKNKAFCCPGGPHHDRSHFDLLRTVKFLPNRVFSFVKTDRSFHGIEPIKCDPSLRRMIVWKLITMN